MRVLHVISSLRVESGGPGLALLEYMRWLDKRGVLCEVLCVEAGAGLASGSVHVIARPGSQFLLGAADREISALLKSSDVVHLHGIWDGIVIAAARLAGTQRKPLICTPHGMLAPWSMARHRLRKWPYFRLFTGPALRRASAFHFITQAEQDLARRWLPPGASRFVVPIILAEPFYCPPPAVGSSRDFFPQVPRDGPWVLFLSRIHPKKGLPRLIRAFPEVLRGFPSAKLLIAGTGDDKYVRRMRDEVQALGIAGSVFFLGLVDGPAKLALYRDSSVLAVPSSQENFGMVFAESLACGTPVLLTRHVDLHHELVQAGSAFLSDTTPESVAAQLLLALGDGGLRRRMGAVGRDWVLNYLKPEIVAARLGEEYLRVLSRLGG